MNFLSAEKKSNWKGFLALAGERVYNKFAKH